MAHLGWLPRWRQYSKGQAVVLEKLDRVGGLARTLEFDGNRFDIGPHRFFTLNEEVKELFIAVCGPDLINVPRLTASITGTNISTIR